MKKDFRKKVIEYRNNKDTDFISTNSQKITEKLLSMNCIKDANTIMLYLDFNNEVKTDQLITKLISLRKTVAAPVTLKNERKLIPFKITNLKDGINIGAYGIREPKKDPYNELNVEDIDILIVPAVAYDKDCYRLGYGGGFYDPGNNSTGGMPTGVTISNGKVITDNNYSSYTQSGGIIGITNDNKLVLIKGATAQKALNMNVRDGVSWGPFLIVNGKKSFIKGNGGWGYAARTAIGQRSDGIILLLVINSNSSRTKGADMVDLTDIMDKYGAINAANLDGGTSTVMVLPNKESLKYISSCDKAYCYINDPVDGALRHRTRGIATSIIVTSK